MEGPLSKKSPGYKGLDGVNKFNILDVQRQIRFMNKVVIINIISVQ